MFFICSPLIWQTVICDYSENRWGKVMSEDRSAGFPWNYVEKSSMKCGL